MIEPQRVAGRTKMKYNLRFVISVLPLVGSKKLLILLKSNFPKFRARPTMDNTFSIAKRILSELERASLGERLSASIEADFSALSTGIQFIISRLKTKDYYLVKNLYMAPKKLCKAINGLDSSHYENIVYCCGLVKELLVDLDVVKSQGLLEKRQQEELTSKIQRKPVLKKIPTIAAPIIESVSRTNDESEMVQFMSDFMAKSFSKNDLLSDFGGILKADDVALEYDDHDTADTRAFPVQGKMEIIFQFKGSSYKRQVATSCSLKDLIEMVEYEFAINDCTRLWVQHNVSGHKYILENVNELHAGSLVYVEDPAVESTVINRSNLMVKKGEISTLKNDLLDLRRQLKDFVRQTISLTDYTHSLLSAETLKQSKLESRTKYELESVMSHISKYSTLLETLRKDLIRGYPKPHSFVQELIQHEAKCIKLEVDDFVSKCKSYRMAHDIRSRQIAHESAARGAFLDQITDEINLMTGIEAQLSDMASGVIEVLKCQNASDGSSFESRHRSSEVRRHKNQTAANSTIDRKISYLKALKLGSANSFLVDLKERADEFNGAAVLELDKQRQEYEEQVMRDFYLAQ